MGKKLIFACPSYGPTEPSADVSRRLTIMHAAANGHTWIGDSSSNRMGWTDARNVAVRGALETDADYICWADSDVIFPPGAFTALLSLGLDFVTGIYFQRGAPHWPLISQYRPERDSFSFLTDWPENVIAPVDGCGFGCVITSLKMLRALPEPWFKYEKFSEDFDFCRKASKAGFQLFVHTGVLCEHLADPRPVGLEDFRKSWADAEKGVIDGSVRSEVA